MDRARGHLEGAVARLGDALGIADLEADLALTHGEALDEVVVDMRPGDRRSGLQPEVDLDAPPICIRRDQGRDLAGRRVVEPAAGNEWGVLSLGHSFNLPRSKPWRPRGLAEMPGSSPREISGGTGWGPTPEILIRKRRRLGGADSLPWS